MLAKETPDFKQLEVVRDNIQERLRPVLSRTERPTEAASSFKANHPHSEIRPEDLRVFKHWVARLQEAETPQRGKVDLMSFRRTLLVVRPLADSDDGAWLCGVETRGKGTSSARRADTPTFSA